MTLRSSRGNSPQALGLSLEQSAITFSSELEANASSTGMQLSTRSGDNEDTHIPTFYYDSITSAGPVQCIDSPSIQHSAPECRIVERQLHGVGYDRVGILQVPPCSLNVSVAARLALSMVFTNDHAVSTASTLVHDSKLLSFALPNPAKAQQTIRALDVAVRQYSNNKGKQRKRKREGMGIFT
ncbi:hypothetical protein AC578_4233 [Pseudocercospora eumusae]|uniref:Uncharacterized protein n=1 Tax=Pseudocercospora eumusae TaxID=321146 RepID=A0A139H3B0_9PEZI|nr:hypothetical protein AC578_4233 [Pseudocercospora eumusae]